MRIALPLAIPALWLRRQRWLALFFALTGGLAWWQLRGLPDDTASADQRPRVPDYVALDFAAVETAASGQPARRLAAAELRQYVDERLIELDAPRLTLFQDAQPPWQARAREGRILEDGDEVRLSGDVQLEHAGGATARAVRLETASLTIWRGPALAVTDRPVRIDSAGDWLTAAGMRVWYGEPSRALFMGPVQVWMAPAASAGGGS